METVVRRPRNVMIDIWKFVYAWFIVFYHIYKSTGLHFAGGYYAVEFYLLAAGVFFFSRLEKDLEDTPRYIGRRFMRFFPWSFTAFIFAFVVIRIVIDGNVSPGRLIKYLSGDIWEILLVNMSGLNGGAYPVNGPAWTLSSMFLVEIIMIGCFRYKKAFVNIVLPLTLMVGFGYWRAAPSATIPNWIGFTTFGTFRAWVVYGCAYYCLQLSKHLRDKPFTRLGKSALTALETFCHAFAIVAMLTTKSRNFQWCTLLAFLVAIAISMSGHSLWNVWLAKSAPASRFLGAFSLSLYLMHRPVEQYFAKLYPDNGVRYAHLLPILAAIILCALAQYLLVTGLIWLWRKNADKIKALFIREPASD